MAAFAQDLFPLLARALEARVRRLVYTSSPSVVFDGRDHRRAGSDLIITYHGRDALKGGWI